MQHGKDMGAQDGAMERGGGAGVKTTCKQECNVPRQQYIDQQRPWLPPQILFKFAKD